MKQERKRMERCRTRAWPLALLLATIITSATRLPAATLYVSQTSTNPVPPYATPSTAAQYIQDAVNVANNGDTVLVEPGEYDLTNQVTITKAITLRSSLGAGQTFVKAISARYSTNAIWCLWISNSLAVVDGFTLDTKNTSIWGAYAGGVDSFGATIQNCIFNNFTMQGPGPGTSVTMAGGILSNSVAYYNFLAAMSGITAVYCTGGGLVTDCQILGTDGRYTGTGIYLENSQLSNSVVIGTGTGEGTESGATPAVQAVNSTITGCTISRNYSQETCGGAYLNNCLMDRCVVAFNIADAPVGGGIFEVNSIIRNSLIVSNSTSILAPDPPPCNGGGVYMQGGALVNCTVSENSAADGWSETDELEPGQGGGVYVESGGITNSIIYDNYATMGANWTNASAGVFDHSCTTPDPGGVGNITQDPQFLDLANGNFHQADNSPCVAAGVVQSWMNSAEDLDGNPRTDGGSVDLGAYESQNGQGQNTGQMVKVLDPRRINAGIDDAFSFSFQTQTNHAYTIQYTHSLSPANWQTLTNFSGDGTMVNVTNQNPANPSCFYRVVAQ